MLRFEQVAGTGLSTLSSLRSARRGRQLLLACLLPLLLVGCGTRCERVCRKLLECGDEGWLETDRFSQFECSESCRRQGEIFDGWEDEGELRGAWRDHRRCLIQEDCEDIAAGVCYDERFFIVGEE